MVKKSSKIAKNSKAFFDYEILERFEAGIVLSGTEVRSLRDNNCQLVDTFIMVRNGELWLNNLHITPYAHGGFDNQEPLRRRKLLMHKKQIRYLGSATAEKGMSIIPLSIYFDNSSRVKLEIGLAKGKKNYDKRADIAKRDSDREIRRALKERSR